MKFIKKPEVVTAKQWSLNEPVGVKAHNGCEYRMCPICQGASSKEIIYYIQSSGMQPQYVKPGDWIIFNNKGRPINVYSDTTFREMYSTAEGHEPLAGLENHVCTSDQAKKLNELGIVQGVSFFFFDSDGKLFFNKDKFAYFEAMSCFSAFTEAELGKILPSTIGELFKSGTRRGHLHIQKKHEKEWYVAYWNSRVKFDSRFELYREGENLPQAMCKMLIHLLERGIVTAEQANQKLNDSLTQKT